jgi:hypothetical protein
LHQLIKKQKTMKKLMLVAAVVAVGLSSCKKDYTCTCTYTGGVTGSVSTTVTATKKDAKSSCESGSSSAGGNTVTCKIN